MYEFSKPKEDDSDHVRNERNNCKTLRLTDMPLHDFLEWITTGTRIVDEENGEVMIVFDYDEDLKTVEVECLGDSSIMDTIEGAMKS